MENKISIVLPVYNEEEAVAQTIKEVKEAIERTEYPYEIIAVDDGSKDRSIEVLGKIKGIKVMHHPYNLGYGAALKTGIKAAKGDWILITDVDGTYPIKDIPKLLGYIKEYDMVVGARGKGAKVPLLRRPAKKILSMLANFLSGRKIPDLNSGFRVFKKEIALEFFHLFPQGFSFTTTITLACLTNGYTVKCIPIEYFKRKGKSSISPIKDFSSFFSTIIRVITYFKPFKIFSLISAFLFILSLAVFLYSKLYLGQVMDITVVVILLSSLQVFLFGLIADLIAKKVK